VKLTHLQLVPRSRKCGSIQPLPHTPSWRSAYLVKHRDNFTFYLPGTPVYGISDVTPQEKGREGSNFVILEAKLSDLGSRRQGTLTSPNLKLRIYLVELCQMYNVYWTGGQEEQQITVPVGRSNCRDGLKSIIGYIRVML
jgi:hypothetical protein